MPVLEHETGKDGANVIAEETHFNDQSVCSEIQIKLEPEVEENDNSDVSFSGIPVFLGKC